MRENFKLAFSIMWRQVASLFFLLLFVSSLVSFFLGQKVDGIIIISIMVINALIGFFQEYKASRASEKLLHLVQTKVYVYREGILKQVNVEDLVLDDVVHFGAGSVIPLDIRVIEQKEAYIDDSMRTGESLPKNIKMGDNLFSGAVVASGKITGQVIALFDSSSISKYRNKLESVKKWSSFNVFTDNVIKYVFIVSLSSLLIAMFFLVFVMGKYTLAHFFVFAIAMLVGVVPEMLPLVIMLILTRESLSLSFEKVIVKRLSALSSLGAVKFLLTDKTGTITENKLKVSFVSDISNFWEYSNAISEGEYERTPMDSAYDFALNSSLGKIKTGIFKITNFEQFKHELGYEIFTLENGQKIARGIIGEIISLCNKSKSSSPILSSYLDSALLYEMKGMRVMAIASSYANEWSFSGFVAFYDPVKESSAMSLQIAHKWGIGVKILTGDSVAVARNVAEELHMIHNAENIISLDMVKVSDLSDKQLLHIIVFAKCTPENKLELISRYLKLGPVAFLGDGINDALALKHADIGIAVDNASDIAKESSDIILLEKDLSPILKSVSTGRRALRNILTYIIYTLAGNAGTFFSLLIASFFYPVLPMLPIQILLNNLLTDLPLMLIITDNVDEYALSHVPHLEPKKIMKRVLIFGLVSSFFDLIYFQLYKGVGVLEFQTGWFILSILAELALILSIRSSRSIWKSPPISKSLGIGIIISIIISFIFIYGENLSHIFKFTKLPLETIAVILCLIIIYITFNEIAKYFMRRRNLYNKPITGIQIFKTE
ncbi:MAG: HAD-IC family P-type ATPase [Patescibacteria group bacterium]